MRTQRAIILRTYFPEKRKLSVFDEQLGRIGILYQRNVTGYLCNGALIRYQRERHTGSDFFIGHHIEVLHIPFRWAHFDILFLHQILELTYFFTPLEGCCAAEVFTFILKIYQEKIENLIVKKVILCKLFYLLGIYPEDALEKMSDLFSLISLPWDIMLDKNANEQLTMNVDAWLAGCIAKRPYTFVLKTLQNM